MTSADKIERIGYLYVKFLKARKSRNIRAGIYHEMAHLTEDVCHDDKVLDSVKAQLRQHLVIYRKMLNS